VAVVKRFFGSAAVRGALCWLGAQYIRLVYATGRWTLLRGEIVRDLLAARQPFIVAFWHGRLLMMPLLWPGTRTFRMLISQHRYGKIIASTVGHFGIRTIAGSTRKGGAAAMRAMLRALKAGECVGITPDGPRGPYMRASDGIVQVARMAGVPIVPGTFAVGRRRVLGTWDRFVVPWPFTRGILAWGEPIRVDRDADDVALEAARRRVEDGINAITREADILAGVEPVEPAPVASPADAEAAP